MKTIKSTTITLMLAIVSLLLMTSCSNDDDNATSQALTELDKSALLFMLEEEKLARDTYIYMDDAWSSNQFANIKNSEQMHMNAIENLLIQNNIEYTILPVTRSLAKEKNINNKMTLNSTLNRLKNPIISLCCFKQKNKKIKNSTTIK